MRLQRTVPLPVPFAVVSVFQACLLVAIHAVVAALVPASVTVALSTGAGFPCCTDTARPNGFTARVTGTGIGVIRSVSNTVAGEPLAAPSAVTVMVST